MKKFALTLTLVAGMITAASAKTYEPVDYVNPLMGTQSKFELSTGNTYPAIARGTTELIPTQDADLCLLRRSWQDESIVIVLNLSAEKKTVAVEAQTLLACLDANTAHGIGAALDGGTLTLDPWGIAILQ